MSSVEKAGVPSLLQTEEWEKLQRALGERCFLEKAKAQESMARDESEEPKKARLEQEKNEKLKKPKPQRKTDKSDMGVRFEQKDDEAPEWQFLAIKKTTPFGPYLYLPYGPYLKNKKAAEECLGRLMTLAKREGVVFIRIEPQQPELVAEWLKLPYCKKSKDLNPAETLKIDLTPDLEGIMAGYSRRNKSYAKNFGKKGVAVRVSRDPQDLEYLIKFQHELAARKGISTFSDEYLATELKQNFACLYLAYYDEAADVSESDKARPADGQVLAATLFFDGQGARHYMQAAADDNFRHLPATLAIVQTAIADAKAAGLSVFDFWGIAPEGAGAEHPWYGFTEFKKSFGGEEVFYAGTHDLVLQGFKYQLYKETRKLNRAMRKARR